MEEPALLSSEMTPFLHLYWIFLVSWNPTRLTMIARLNQMIMVQEPGDAAPDAVEYRHGIIPPMKDARQQRFRREPDLNPELVRRCEENLLTITAGGTAKTIGVEPTEQEKDRDANKKSALELVAKPDDTEPVANAGEPERRDSDESDKTSS